MDELKVGDTIQCKDAEDAEKACFSSGKRRIFLEL